MLVGELYGATAWRKYPIGLTHGNIHISKWPYVETAMLFKDGFHEAEIAESQYFILNRKKGKSHALAKSMRFYDLYCEIRGNGFSEHKSKKSPICVLNEPFYHTRYVVSNGSRAPEIWNGVHRSAICYVLGIQKINCLWMRDNARGTKKCEMLEKKERFAKIK